MEGCQITSLWRLHGHTHICICVPALNTGYPPLLCRCRSHLRTGRSAPRTMPAWAAPPASAPPFPPAPPLAWTRMWPGSTSGQKRFWSLKHRRNRRRLSRMSSAAWSGVRVCGRHIQEVSDWQRGRAAQTGAPAGRGAPASCPCWARQRPCSACKRWAGRGGSRRGPPVFETPAPAAGSATTAGCVCATAPHGEGAASRGAGWGQAPEVVLGEARCLVGGPATCGRPSRSRPPP